MAKVAQDMGLKPKVVPEAIMAPDKWEHRLHRREANDGYHSVYMQPTCMEINVRQRYLQQEAPTSSRHKFRHRGANMALFMPFLHWGSERILDWREAKIRLMEERRTSDPRDMAAAAALPSIVSPSDTPAERFHAQLMEAQLLSDTRPLHLRRTLDQFFYTTLADTHDRDRDQVLSKYGPDRDKAGARPILMVDQLWLWVLGGGTVVTCFDRRWEDDGNFQANVLDRLLAWKLPNNATRIKTAYELAHLVIDEASGFFFSSTSSLPRSLRFAEVFRTAIGSVVRSPPSTPSTNRTWYLFSFPASTLFSLLFFVARLFVAPSESPAAKTRQLTTVFSPSCIDRTTSRPASSPTSRP
jgi:hypothetical protein